MYDEKSETFGTARLEKGETENAIKKSSKDNYCEKLKTNNHCPISSAADSRQIYPTTFCHYFKILGLIRICSLARSSRSKSSIYCLASILIKQVSTNTGPRSAGRYRKQFSLKQYLWLCSSVDNCLAVDLKDPVLITSQGDFFHLNFF